MPAPGSRCSGAHGLKELAQLCQLQPVTGKLGRGERERVVQPGRVAQADSTRPACAGLGLAGSESRLRAGSL